MVTKPFIALLCAAVLLVGCDESTVRHEDAGDSPGIDAGGSPMADAGGSPMADAGDPPASLRGVRYCELLVVIFDAGAVEAQVWGTQGLNLCPEADWASVDLDMVRMELGAVMVLVNGPRYWLLDRIEASSLPTGPTRTFGTLEMRQLATVEVDPTMTDRSPYIERIVNRDTLFTFDAGMEIYVLVADDGSEYVMQSYAQIVDSTLTESDLAGLGARLVVPTGWTYEVRTLDAPLEVRATGRAIVIQDELQNTYQRFLPAG